MRTKPHEWWQTHSEHCLTAAALPLMLISGLRSAHHGLAWGSELVLILSTWLVLTVRIRWPIAVLTAVTVLDSIGIAVAGHGHHGSALLPLATMLALYTVADTCSSRLSWSAAAIVGLVETAVAAGVTSARASTLLYLNWALVSTAIGRLIQERRERIATAEQRAEEAESTKEAEAQRQVVAERMRIAHELHDVLAHHIAVVNAQAGVAQYLLQTDPEAANAALEGITNNSRAALEDLRATLGLLRGGGTSEYGDREPPTPTIDHLDLLIQGFKDSGMDLSSEITGSPGDLSGPADLALIRIIQEALTNASKHAPGSTVTLRLEWLSDSVNVSVTNTKSVTSGTLTNQGASFGILGMHERAEMAGGRVATGPTPDDGYRVNATLPLRPQTSDGGEVERGAEDRPSAPANVPTT